MSVSTFRNVPAARGASLQETPGRSDDLAYVDGNNYAIIEWARWRNRDELFDEVSNEENVTYDHFIAYIQGI